MSTQRFAQLAWLNVYSSWATVRGHSQDIHTLPPVELNKVLKQFFGEIRKKDGKEYEPDCLRVMLGALHRHLTSVNYPGDLITGREFKDCRDVLEGKCRELRANGMGRRPNAANSLSRVEEEQLWEYGRLGANNPTSLLYTNWWNLTQHLGLRGCQEHTSMMVEDFVVKISAEGRKFVEFNENLTKTRQSGLKPKKRTTKPKMFATGGDRCPVRLFELYMSKRPASLQKCGRFCRFDIF